MKHDLSAQPGPKPRSDRADRIIRDGASELLERSELSREISRSFESHRRLLMFGPDGSGRATAVRMALKSVSVVEWDLRFVATEQALEREGAELTHGAAGLQTALRSLEDQAGKRPTALLLKNIDGCSGAEQEPGIIGRLRSEVQCVNALRVFYTAADGGFVGRHFGSSLGSFFKQAAILDVGGFSDIDVNRFAWIVTGAFWEDSARRAGIDCAGRMARDLATLLREIKKAREKLGAASDSLVTCEDVLAAAMCVVDQRKAVYEHQIRLGLLPRQRSVLRSIATGVLARASNALAMETGIQVRSLGSVLQSLEKGGWIERSGRGLARFTDPYLRLYLANQ